MELWLSSTSAVLTHVTHLEQSRFWNHKLIYLFCGPNISLFNSLITLLSWQVSFHIINILQSLDLPLLFFFYTHSTFFISFPEQPIDHDPSFPITTFHSTLSLNKFKDLCFSSYSQAPRYNRTKYTTLMTCFTTKPGSPKSSGSPIRDDTFFNCPWSDISLMSLRLKYLWIYLSLEMQGPYHLKEFFF